MKFHIFRFIVYIIYRANINKYSANYVLSINISTQAI